jgi:hypothetical protein
LLHSGFKNRLKVPVRAGEQIFKTHPAWHFKNWGKNIFDGASDKQ